MSMEQERKTIEAMIRLYCKGQHDTAELCDECSALLDYANARLSKCPFGEEKPKCSKCEVHCYKPEMRKRVTAVMRYSGPRMVIHHPVMALRHLLHEGTPSSKTSSRGVDPPSRPPEL